MKKTSKRAAKFPHEIADCAAYYLKEGDLEGVLSLYHPDAVISFPPDEPVKRGLDGAREVFEPFMDARPTLISKVTGEMINGDTAVLQVDWRFEDSEGKLMAEGQSTEVVKQNAEGFWLYYIDCPLGLPVVV